MKIKKILFPTKMRERAFESLQTLLVLKTAGLEEVVLCYVIPRDEVGFVPFGGYLKDEEERLRGKTEALFKEWKDAISKEGLGSRIIIEVGDPVPKVLSIAERENVDLIVIGKKKVDFLESSFLGDGTMKIIARSEIPTLASKYVVEYESDGEKISRVNKEKFKRPLFVTDLSELSERAFELLLSLDGLIERAFACHVLRKKAAREDEETLFEALDKESRDKLESYRERLKAVGVTSEILLDRGNIVDEVIRMSRAVSASMIIMATTRKDRFHELFQGSVSHEVAQKSELPTLLVP
jgi:nucleotide-binding universal stress UspA family protein